MKGQCAHTSYKKTTTMGYIDLTLALNIVHPSMQTQMTTPSWHKLVIQAIQSILMTKIVNTSTISGQLCTAADCLFHRRKE